LAGPLPAPRRSSRSRRIRRTRTVRGGTRNRRVGPARLPPSDDDTARRLRADRRRRRASLAGRVPGRPMVAAGTPAPLPRRPLPPPPPPPPPRPRPAAHEPPSPFSARGEAAPATCVPSTPDARQRGYPPGSTPPPPARLGG